MKVDMEEFIDKLNENLLIRDRNKQKEILKVRGASKMIIRK